MNWKFWLRGLVSAAIGAAASSVTVVIVDPVAFNFTDQIGKVGMVAAVSALIAVCFYLKKSPLPTPIQVTQGTSPGLLGKEKK